MRINEIDKDAIIKTPKKIIDMEALKYCQPVNADVSSNSFQTFLECISIGDYIETSEVGRGGYVVQIFRDRFGIPVCAKTIYQTEDGHWGYDMASLNAIDEIKDYDWMCD